MKIKLKDEPIFIMAALCIFFPVGIVLLCFAKYPAKQKWVMSISGLLIFSGLLSLALLSPIKPVDPHSFQVTVTRETMSVGQSGGFLITNGDEYYTDFTAKASNRCLDVQNNLYTATAPGSCTLEISFASATRTVALEVPNEPATDSIVLASPSGTRYHLPSAAHAGKHAIEMTEEEALQSQKTPCKNCYK